MRLTGESGNHPDTLLVPTRRRVAVANLELGMFVCELDRPWSETNFAFQGFPLLTPDEVRAVRERCLYVYVDDTRRCGCSTVQRPPPWRHGSARRRSDRAMRWPVRWKRRGRPIWMAPG